MMKTNGLTNLSPFERLGPCKADSTLRLAYPPNVAVPSALKDCRHAADAKIKSILVPLDGTPFAERAIPLALGIAEQSGAVLHLVHVIVPAEVLDPYEALHFPDASLMTLKLDRHRYLKNTVDKIEATSSVFVASRVIRGREVSSSLDGIPGLDADLIVMATHSRGVLGRFWSGSVAHSLLQRTNVPVILVRGTADPVAFNAITIENVLLPLDGSEASEKVLRPIMDLGIFPAARHSLLQVVPLAPKFVAHNSTIRTYWVSSRRNWTAGMEYLNELARTLRDNNRRVHTKVVSSDERIGPVVVRAAEADDVDLIAVTYHRQGSLARLLWPNTSEYLFQNSTRPIMFVPSEPP